MRVASGYRQIAFVLVSSTWLLRQRFLFDGTAICIQTQDIVCFISVISLSVAFESVPFVALTKIHNRTLLRQIRCSSV